MSCSKKCAPYPCTCATNFWITGSGVNQLRGCECDPDNPIRLQDCFIIWSIQHSIKAREDFQKLWPSLFPCEKERFERIFTDHPRYKLLVTDPGNLEDRFQAQQNSGPVRTAGPTGGLRGGRMGRVNLPPHLQPKTQPRHKC